MAGLEGSAGSFTNLKIQVPNDLQTEEGELIDDPGDTRMEEDELEEGEASEDDVEVNVIIREGDAGVEGRTAKDTDKPGWPDKKYENKSGGGFVSGVYEVSNKVLSERARRFGVADAPKSAPTPEAIAKLYKSLDVSDEDFVRGYYRADALYIKGTEDLSTKDVFEYFQAYAAASIEWINDNSCNVVWPDAAGPVRALIGLSCPILPREADLKKSRHTSRRKNGKKIQDCTSDGNNDDEGRPKIKIKKEKKDRSKKKKNKKDEKTSSSSSSSSSSSESDGESSVSDSSSSSSSSSGKSSGSNSSSSSDSNSSENEINVIKEKTKKKKKSVKVKVEKMDEDRVATKTVADDEGSVRIEDVAVPVPPGRWRLGVPCPRTKAVLLRFSSRKDKKPDGAEKKSEYYRKYGNPNFGGIKGLLSESGRRRMREAQRRRELEEGHGWGREEGMLSEASKNPWGALAQNWGRKESQEEDRFDYQALLRQHQKQVPVRKRKRGESGDEDMLEDENNHHHGRHGSYDDFNSQNQGSDDSDDVVPWKSKIKSPRMKMYADDEQKKKKLKKSGDLWNRLSSRKSQTHGRVQDRLTEMPTTKGRDIRSRLDLRSKLSSRKKVGPMSVEVDSDRYYSLIASDDE